MRKISVLAILLVATACTRGPTTDRVGMAFDSATTGMAIADAGLMEANPLLSGLNNMDPVMATVTIFGVKVAAEKGMEYMLKDNPNFEKDFPKKALNSTGMGFGAWNAGLLAGATAAPPLAFGALAVALIDWQWRNFAFSYPWDKDNG